MNIIRGKQQRPQRVVRWEWLGVRDIERSTADHTFTQSPHEIIRHDVSASGHVDDPSV